MGAVDAASSSASPPILLSCIRWLAGWSGALQTRQREDDENKLKYLVAKSSTAPILGSLGNNKPAEAVKPRSLNMKYAVWNIGAPQASNHNTFEGALKRFTNDGGVIIRASDGAINLGKGFVPLDVENDTLAEWPEDAQKLRSFVAHNLGLTHELSLVVSGTIRVLSLHKGRKAAIKAAMYLAAGDNDAGAEYRVAGLMEAGVNTIAAH